MKFWKVQTNFTSGWLSKSLLGRTDITRYFNGVGELENYIVTKRGGIIPRPGTIFVADTKDQDSRVRLIPFVFSTDEAYIIELGDNYARFYKDNAQVESSPGTPLEITTPYDIAQLAQVRFAQASNTMILVHPDVTPQRLQRFTNTSWKMADIDFNLPALSESGVKPAASLTLSATTGSITLTAGSATFLIGDVGREVSAGTGLARITAFTSTTVVSATTVIDFNTTSFTSGNWTLLDSPQSEVQPNGKDVGSSITLTANINTWRDAGFSFSDVNRYVRIDDGVVKITSVTSALIAVATVIKQLSKDADITTAPPDKAFPGGWSIETTMWTSTLGFPQTVALYEGRLIFGGSFSFPTTLWGSEVGNAFNFFTGILDSSPFQFALDSGRYDLITAVEPSNNLVVMTYGGEYSLNGRNDGPITATNTAIRKQSSYGCKGIEPVSIGNGIVFVQRSGRKIMFYQYDPNNVSYQGKDATSLNDEITLEGITNISFAQEPYQLVYGVTNGTMAVLCIEPEEEVFGWSLFTGGRGMTFHDVATIPISDKDQTWCICRLNDRYVVQYFDFESSLDGQETVTEVTATTSFTGFDHLAFSDADVLLDGQPVMNVFVDETGTLTTPYEGYEIKVGYFFESRAKLLPVEEIVGGSVQGRKGAINEVYVKVLNTQCLSINGKHIEFRRFGASVLDDTIVPITEDLRVTEMGWDNSQNEIVLQRLEPLSQYILSVNRTVSVNG